MSTNPETLPPLPEGKAVVRGPVSAFRDPESGTLVDFDCEGPLSHDPEDGEELFTADQMREYARAALLAADGKTGDKCPDCGGPGLLRTCVWCGSSTFPADYGKAGGEVVADEGLCKDCAGSGRQQYMTYGRGPDDYEYEAECETCKGTGSSDVRDIIKSLPYQPNTVKPGLQMVDRSEVLRVIDTHPQPQAEAVRVPDGYVPVPVEPTPKMIVQGCVALHAASHSDLVATDGEIVSMYCAMLAAAPKPQETSLCSNCVSDGKCMKRQELCFANGTAQKVQESGK